jgi:hypothetical protein
MKGPTPIISNILKATAERRPMRRCKEPVLAEMPGLAEMEDKGWIIEAELLFEEYRFAAGVDGSVRVFSFRA